jgi:hypothetical protein
MSDFLDSEAPMPYIRRKNVVDFKPTETKFVFDREVTSTKITTRESIDEEASTLRETIEDTVTEIRPRKVTLYVYERSEKEDSEHFFEAFNHMQDQIRVEYNAVSQNQNNDATIVFSAMDSMLGGNAKTEWHDVLATREERNWKDFKELVAQFITTKILPEDAYNSQLTYMRERSKPMGLTVRDWWLRMQTINRYLPYFFGSMDALKAELPSANFSHWWRDGGLSKADQRRIVITKIPMEWESQLRLNDSTHTLRIEKSIDALVDYLTTIENVEKLTLQRQRARTMAHNRRIYEGRGRNTQRDFRRQNYYTRGGSSQQGRYNSGRNIYGSADPHFRYQGQRALTRTYQPQPGSYHSALHLQGGRAGYPIQGRHGGRFGGQRSGYHGLPPRRGANRGGGSFGRGPVPTSPRSSEQFAQETDVQEEEEHSTQEDELHYAEMTEDQLINEWNENLYMDADEHDEAAFYDAEEFEVPSYEDPYYDEAYYKDGWYL